MSGTLQPPFPRLGLWQERLRNPPEGLYHLIACADDEVVGELTLNTTPTRPGIIHAGSVGMAVRDDW